MRLRTSPAAEFQSLQTRAIMGAVLWSRAFSTVLFVWIALTVWVIWWRVGVYAPASNHAYFFRWMLCGILNDTPWLNRLAPWLPMYADGGWYTLPSFTDWLDGPQMYQASFYSWYWHTTTGLGGFYGLGTELFPLACLALLIAWRWHRDPDATDHLRGLRLLTPRRLDRQLNGSWLRQMYRAAPLGRLNGAARRGGIWLGSSLIPGEKEFEHFLISGNPGSGKSTAIRQMLMQIQDRGQPAVVLDVDSEFIQEFYNEARGDVVLQPLDRRCPFWSPWSELRDEWFTVDAAAMAASLIRGKPRDQNQAFFQESTRTVLEAILHVVHQGAHAGDLLDFVSLPRGKLHQALKGTPAYPLIDPDASEQGAGILGTAVNAIKIFVYLPRREQAERSWSAREWAQERRGWLFLPSREDLRAATHVLQGLWLDCLVRWLMTAEIGSDQVWLMADELASLGHQPQIEQLMVRGRKRGLAVVLGLQNVSQLRAIYGPDSAITLTSSPSTKLILRVDETETAQWASELIGSHEVERLQMTQLAGLSTYREGINLQPQRSIERLVLADEIKLLEPFNGYLCMAGTDRTTSRIPRLYLTKNSPAFVPRVASPAPSSTAEPKEPDAGILAQLMTREGRPAAED